MNTCENTTTNAPARVSAIPAILDEQKNLYFNSKDGSFIITKESGKSKEIKRFNIAPNYEPKNITSIQDICSEYIFNYCVSNGYVDWLIEAESASTKNARFLPSVFRSKFAERFCPNIVNEPAKQMTVRRAIARLAEQRKAS